MSDNYFNIICDRLKIMGINISINKKFKLTKIKKENTIKELKNKFDITME